MSIASNLAQIKSTLHTGVELIAVSKTYPPEALLEAYEGGQRHFGENRVQELTEKHEQLPNDICWHMIGTLQRNKVKYIAPYVHLIHSVDSIELLEEINKHAGRNHRVISCLLQVYIATEETKHGFLPEEVLQFFKQNEQGEYPNVHIIGLMGMASFTTNEAQVRAEFRGLKALFDKLNLEYNAGLNTLSMGMSGDYRIAMEEG
ncbi:MAG: YggS family pyridoxal phosphate-dependent enzyme, partial [Bacteroidia bacterium]